MTSFHIKLGKKTYFGAIISGDLNLVLHALLDPRCPIGQSRNRQIEHTELVLACVELISIPLIEVTKLLCK